MARTTIPIRLKKNLLRKAKLMSPIDTGNLRHNAIYGRLWSNPTLFNITYDLQSAGYIEPLEEGWTDAYGNEHTKWKGFIALTASAVASEFLAYFKNGELKKTRRISKKEIIGDYNRIARHAQSLSRWKSIKNEFKDLDSAFINKET